MSPRPDPKILHSLASFDTCIVANAVETFGVRLRNEGYTKPGLKCFFPKLAPAIGYAVTARVKSAEPPISGNAYVDRTDWWAKVNLLPKPLIAVIQDIDKEPGTGAVAGEVHSAILQALGCTALVTNGAVRDLAALRRLRLPVFASHACPSHAYIHMVDFGKPVEVYGLEIGTGDLLMCDCHGVISIPPSLAPELPTVAERLTAHERAILELCRSPEFSLEELKAKVGQDAS